MAQGGIIRDRCFLVKGGGVSAWEEGLELREG